MFLDRDLSKKIIREKRNKFKIQIFYVNRFLKLMKMQSFIDK